MLSEVQGAVCEQSCDKGNSFPFSLIGRNSNFGSIAHWLMGKSLNPSVLSCKGRILIFLARIMAGSYMLPIVSCQVNAWYMKVTAFVFTGGRTPPKSECQLGLSTLWSTSYLLHIPHNTLAFFHSASRNF